MSEDCAYDNVRLRTSSRSRNREREAEVAAEAASVGRALGSAVRKGESDSEQLRQSLAELQSTISGMESVAPEGKLTDRAALFSSAGDYDVPCGRPATATATPPAVPVRTRGLATIQQQSYSSSRSPLLARSNNFVVSAFCCQPISRSGSGAFAFNALLLLAAMRASETPF